MTKHTPGPWEIVTDSDNYNRQCKEDFYCTILSKDDWHICRVWNDAGEKKVEEAGANARLIAAAPEMLAMLEELAEGQLKYVPVLGTAKGHCVVCHQWGGHRGDCKLSHLLKKARDDD